MSSELSSVRFNTLDEWLHWQERAHPNAIDLGLDRVRDVAAVLELLEPSATVITVAGTNGKGSCVATLAYMMKASGRSYGAYTSPHIENYNERININGIEVSDEELCQAFAAIDNARGQISLTYFEFGTLAALYLFAKANVDFWLLEVGLGGRLDAINIIDPQLAVITSIDIDHIDWLGDNRESIGFEKAGICRPDTPLVCADPNPPQSVLKVAQDLHCPLSLLNKDFGFESLQSRELRVWGSHFSHVFPQLRLPPASVAAALQAMAILGLLESSNTYKDDISGLGLLNVSGRLQELRLADKTLVLDVAHNPAAMTHLVKQMRQYYPNKKIKLVLAMMRDKNIIDSLLAIKDIVDQWNLTTIVNFPRAAEVSDLSGKLHQLDSEANCRTFASVSAALKALVYVDQQDVDAIILVTGSFYCVAEAVGYYGKHCVTGGSDNG